MVEVFVWSDINNDMYPQLVLLSFSQCGLKTITDFYGGKYRYTLTPYSL